MKEKQAISGSGKLAAQSAAVAIEGKSTSAPPKRVITGSGALAAQPAGTPQKK